MTIKAGFGGQTFIPALLDKVRSVREIAGDPPVLQVDGGVNVETIGACVDAGAQWMVAGSAVFRTDDYSAAHREMLEIARGKSECGNQTAEH